MSPWLLYIELCLPRNTYTCCNTWHHHMQKCQLLIPFCSISSISLFHFFHHSIISLFLCPSPYFIFPLSNCFIFIHFFLPFLVQYSICSFSLMWLSNFLVILLLFLFWKKLCSKVQGLNKELVNRGDDFFLFIYLFIFVLGSWSNPISWRKESRGSCGMVFFDQNHGDYWGENWPDMG